jgi:putative aldouronate transport system permease protein
MASISKKSILYELKKNRVLYLMAVPAILCYLAFNYLPMVGAIIAFKDYNFTSGLKGIFSSPFIQPIYKNFEFFFTSGYAWRVTRNTLFLNFSFITIGIIFEVGFAITHIQHPK